MRLISVYHSKEALEILYRLLQERKPEQNISHKEMPTWDQHVSFVQSVPYKAWYLIQNEANEFVGSTYLSKQNEIGIFIFDEYQSLGYGKDVVEILMSQHAGPYLANINPNNSRSIQFFRRMGFSLIQHTYAFK